MLDEVLLAALVIGWAVVLLPSALRSRRSTDPMTTVGGFTRAMSVLRDRPQGREIMVPNQADRIVRYGRQPGASSSAPTERSRRGDLLGAAPDVTWIAGRTVVSKPSIGSIPPGPGRPNGRRRCRFVTSPATGVAASSRFAPSARRGP